MSPDTMMIVNLVSPDDRYDATFLSNYATIYIKTNWESPRRGRHHVSGGAITACAPGSIRTNWPPWD